MKVYLTALLTILSASLWAQDTMHHSAPLHPVYVRHSVQAALSLGFIDANRQYTLPSGFEKTNTSGYANIAAKIEYGLTSHIGLAANIGYDAFSFNYAQVYQGSNGPFLRYRANAERIFSLGLIASYHLGYIIKVKRLDPFVGVGLSLNNTRYSAYPQGDSAIVKLEHTVTPYLKAGARYYISDRFSLYGDLGYEHQSIFSLGCSCRFFSHPDGKK